jgi:hypothetical protein
LTQCSPFLWSVRLCASALRCGACVLFCMSVSCKRVVVVCQCVSVFMSLSVRVVRWRQCGANKWRACVLIDRMRQCVALTANGCKLLQLSVANRFLVHTSAILATKLGQPLRVVRSCFESCLLCFALCFGCEFVWRVCASRVRCVFHCRCSFRRCISRLFVGEDACDWVRLTTAKSQSPCSKSCCIMNW